jgi:hypothetical protein
VANFKGPLRHTLNRPTERNKKIYWLGTIPLVSKNSTLTSRPLASITNSVSAESQTDPAPTPPPKRRAGHLLSLELGSSLMTPQQAVPQPARSPAQPQQLLSRGTAFTAGPSSPPRAWAPHPRPTMAKYQVTTKITVGLACLHQVPSARGRCPGGEKEKPQRREADI